MTLKYLPYLLMLMALSVNAQENVFNSERVSGAMNNSNAFNVSRQCNGFNDQRSSLNEEYAKMLKGNWVKFNEQRIYTMPDRNVKPKPPVIFNKNNDLNGDINIAIEEVVNPIQDVNPPKPIAPIKDDSGGSDKKVLAFTFMGTDMMVRVPDIPFSLSSVDNASVAEAWQLLSSDKFATMTADCIKLKSKYKLCDWAYLQMLLSLSNEYCADENSRTLLVSYLFSQSGYKIRLAQNGNMLEMLYGSKHKLYDKSWFNIDGEQFYTLSGRGGSLQISGARFPAEKSLSLWIGLNQSFDSQLTKDRSIVSKKYGDMQFVCNVNKNLIDFYNTYPTSEVDDNFLTRWAMYANTPISSEVLQSFYPDISSKLVGLSKLEAVEKLLNWVQTGFVYEYDDKVWGRDRAFFAEETLYYPYCDCEDRSILFSRLVRDLLGLDVALIYYPGHLATAVRFTDDVKGDYMTINGAKYIVCDPTYIGAPVGEQMPDLEHCKAKAIVLNR